MPQSYGYTVLLGRPDTCSIHPQRPRHDDTRSYSYRYTETSPLRHQMPRRPPQEGAGAARRVPAHSRRPPSCETREPDANHMSNMDIRNGCTRQTLATVVTCQFHVWCRVTKVLNRPARHVFNDQTILPTSVRPSLSPC